MRVKLRTIMAGPNGVSQPGDIVDLPKEDAQRLIDGGQADAVSGVAVTERAVDVPSEERETADSPPHRSGRRPKRGQ